MENLRLNEYRILWTLVLFDIPTVTKAEKKMGALFRKRLMKDGFVMFQYSIYMRHCASRENADVHIKRVRKWLPPRGHVAILTVTDKQFGMIEHYYSKKKEEMPEPSGQLELF